MMWFSGASLVILLSLGALLPAAAQSPQSAALKEIRETAADICVTVEQKGQKSNAQLTGEVQTKIAGVAAKVAELGVKGSGQIGSEEYQGISQEALATALGDIRTCRQHVFDKLVDKILPPQNSILTPREFEKPAGSSRDTQQGSLSNVLYETGTRGFENWSLTPDWKRLKSMLLNDGTGPYSKFAPAFAPYQPKDSDYAVEAEIRVVSPASSFGVVVRAEGEEGYAVGIGAGWGHTAKACYLKGWWGTNDLNGCVATGQAFEPSTVWHKYRIEVKENTIRMLVDGGELLKATDNRFLSAGRVGLWSNKYQLEVRNFRVTRL